MQKYLSKIQTIFCLFCHKNSVQSPYYTSVNLLVPSTINWKISLSNPVLSHRAYCAVDLRTFFEEVLYWNNILNYKSNNQKCNNAMLCIHINTMVKSFSYKNDILNQMGRISDFGPMCVWLLIDPLFLYEIRVFLGFFSLHSVRNWCIQSQLIFPNGLMRSSLTIRKPLGYKGSYINHVDWFLGFLTPFVDTF